MKIGEIAAAATRNQDLFTDFVRMLQDDYPPATAPRFNCTHQPGSACPQNDDVVSQIHGSSLTGASLLVLDVMEDHLSVTGLTR